MKSQARQYAVVPILVFMVFWEEIPASPFTKYLPRRAAQPITVSATGEQEVLHGAVIDCRPAVLFRGRCNGQLQLAPIGMRPVAISHEVL